MRRAYVVVGENPYTAVVESFYAICHSMERAEDLCFEAESDDPDQLMYTWYEVIEEDD